MTPRPFCYAICRRMHSSPGTQVRSGWPVSWVWAAELGEDGWVNAPAELPADYTQLLDHLKSQVRRARIRATRIVNTELLTLYWDIGHAIVQRQEAEGWGTKVIDKLAVDLRAAFPDMRGLSRTNLKYMRQMASIWDRGAIGQQPVGQLPWGHITVLLDKLDNLSDRDWYAATAAEHGWSRNVLHNQINSGLRRRIGAAPSNFQDHLPAEDSDLAQQLVRDPYVFDFLDITERVGRT